MTWCYYIIFDAIYLRMSTKNVAVVKRHRMYYQAVKEKTQKLGYIYYKIYSYRLILTGWWRKFDTSRCPDFLDSLSSKVLRPRRSSFPLPRLPRVEMYGCSLTKPP